VLSELIIAGGVWAKLRALGPVGEILLGLADASVVPTPGSLDLLLILLVGSSPHNWWTYVLAATVGSSLGAYVTYRIGLKGGKEGLAKRIPEWKLSNIYRWSEQYGVGAVAVPAFLPPPFPLSPSLLAAGVITVPKTKFLPAYSSGRLVRYGVVAWLGRKYGQSIIRAMQHYSRPIIWALILLGVLGGIAVAGYLWRRKQHGLPMLHSAEKKAA